MLIGALGFWCMELSYLPQIARLYQRKHAADVSAAFPLLNILGRLFATAYAVHQGQAVFAFGFLLGSCVRFTFLLQVIYYRRLTSRALRANLLPQRAHVHR
jgi:uncharacterized protein with PQ loop repeat